MLGLRVKLLLSVMLPMFTLLVIFGKISFDAAHQRDMSELSKTTDVAAAAVHAYLALNKKAIPDWKVSDAENTAKLLVKNGTANSEVFLLHDQKGRLIDSPFNVGVDRVSLLNAISEIHGASALGSEEEKRGMLMVDEKLYIWSTSKGIGREQWITSVLESPDDHTVSKQLFSPKFVLMILFVIVMSIWTSAYVIKKFLDNIESSAKELEYQTLHDPLTGLPNRLSAQRMITERINSVDESSEYVALLMIDVIDFREINDTLGHALGDRLLVKIGQLLKEIDTEDTEMIRMGGDVFCMVCTTKHDCLYASRLTNLIHDQFSGSHYLDDIPIAVQLRVGVSFYPSDAKSTDALIRCSDIALAQAKSMRLNNFNYQDEIDTHSLRKLTLLARLRNAIDQDQLTLVYQPKIDIQQQRIVGVEVLVRWFDDQYGAVSPAEFVGWAERSGLVNNLTRWVLRTAEKQCFEWCSKGYRIPFSINISPTNLYDAELIPLVSRLITKGCFGDGMLELEITENAVMEDPDKALQTMNILKKMGIPFAIDDFGTGLSSFTYLSKFPISNLKIDRAFVLDVDESDKDAVLLRSMINLGHGLGCVITAEGVEDQESMDTLKELNCDYVQGYYICHPLPADQFMSWMDGCNWTPVKNAA